jgi:hypothetical protein
LVEKKKKKSDEAIWVTVTLFFFLDKGKLPKAAERKKKEGLW